MNPHEELSFLRKMGLEPTRPTGHKILSLACLPIPALPLSRILCNRKNDTMVFAKKQAVFFILKTFSLEGKSASGRIL